MRLFKDVPNCFSREITKVLSTFSLPATLQKPAGTLEIFDREGKMVLNA